MLHFSDWCKVLHCIAFKKEGKVRLNGWIQESSRTISENPGNIARADPHDPNFPSSSLSLYSTDRRPCMQLEPLAATAMTEEQARNISQKIDNRGRHPSVKRG